jgi:hypothetical protein
MCMHLIASIFSTSNIVKLNCESWVEAGNIAIGTRYLEAKTRESLIEINTI